MLSTEQYQRAPRRLGDAHNFGRAVHQFDEKYLYKPRPIAWEYLFLNPKSELRKLLNQSSKFSFLPDLDIVLGEDGCGYTEILKFDENRSIPVVLSHELASAMGSLMAMAIWFGISDLHFENVLFGIKNGQVILAPIDIECALQKVRFPSQTAIVNWNSNLVALSGLSFFAQAPSDFGFLADIIESYFETLFFIESKSEQIFQILTKEKNLTSRVLLRHTSHYANFLKYGTKLSKELLPEEIEQLARNEIPYFFRYADSKQILYLSSENDRFSIGSPVHSNYEIFVSEFRLLKRDQFPVPHELFKFWMEATPIQYIKCLTYFHGLIEGEGGFGDTRIKIRDRVVYLKYKEHSVISKI